MENTTLVFKLLSITAFSLLAIVTLGIAYLTVSDWRDRRRRENERRELAASISAPAMKPGKAKKTKG
ncbi:MAG: hypothetical protein EAZ61_12100 [Oscillatoriales cyanobacterium]|nr:MAG: hypothetical protein EAZ61_12100 [Oscillatoriales cyanobacterium]